MAILWYNICYIESLDRRNKDECTANNENKWNET